MNLAKHPSSTVQILGAEKALFRALKTKHDTPKYGLIYHASLVGQTTPKIKGKMSRMLAAKATLATRCDALGDAVNADMGIEQRAKLERRLRQLEEGKLGRVSGTGKTMAKWEKYENKSEVKMYNPAADSTLGQKRKFDEAGDASESPMKKKIKKEPVEEDSDDATTPKPKKKKKKDKKSASEAEESIVEPETPEPSSEKKKKKRKSEEAFTEPETPEPSSEKKKKKKKKDKKKNEESD